MAAESEKTNTLVLAELSPTVAKAAGESFRATRRRPNALRRITPTSTAHRAVGHQHLDHERPVTHLLHEGQGQAADGYERALGE